MSLPNCLPTFLEATTIQNLVFIIFTYSDYSLTVDICIPKQCKVFFACLRFLYYVYFYGFLLSPVCMLVVKCVQVAGYLQLDHSCPLLPSIALYLFLILLLDKFLTFLEQGMAGFSSHILSQSTIYRVDFVLGVLVLEFKDLLPSGSYN